MRDITEGDPMALLILILGAALLTVSMVAVAIAGRVQKVTVLCYQPVRRSAIGPAPRRNVIQVKPTEIKVIDR